MAGVGGRPKGDYFNALKAQLSTSQIERIKALQPKDRAVAIDSLLKDSNFSGTIPGAMTLRKAFKEIVGE